jgi:next-to-BRCA1 protein 1
MLNVENSRPSAVSDIANASESNVIGRSVQVGEQIGFKVVLKAPMREGKHISYWRMKSADGTPFGHRLWCDIEVKKPLEAPAPEARALPPMAPPVYNSPFDSSQQAQLSRMQAIRQQQIQQMQLQNILAQQQAAQAHQNRPLPPPYEAGNPANISARIAAMREQQAKRREHMMAQFNAHREQLQAQGIKREDMPGWNQHFNPAIGGASSTEQNEEDKARKEAARVRVEHIKAKILRAREEKAKLMEAKGKAAAEKENAEKSAKVQKIVEEVTKEAPVAVAEPTKAAPAEDVEGSQMVFPKLEKESPASSTYQSATSSSSNKGKAAYVENEAGEVERSATPASPAAPVQIPIEVASPSVEEPFVELEEDDDLEVLSADGEESEDDGFVTDEEYDILDASDEETVASK